MIPRLQHMIHGGDLGGIRPSAHVPNGWSAHSMCGTARTAVGRVGRATCDPGRSRGRRVGLGAFRVGHPKLQNTHTFQVIQILVER